MVNKKGSEGSLSSASIGRMWPNKETHATHMANGYPRTPKIGTLGGASTGIPPIPVPGDSSANLPEYPQSPARPRLSPAAWNRPSDCLDQVRGTLERFSLGALEPRGRGAAAPSAPIPPTTSTPPPPPLRRRSLVLPASSPLTLIILLVTSHYHHHLGAAMPVNVSVVMLSNVSLESCSSSSPLVDQDSVKVGRQYK